MLRVLPFVIQIALFVFCLVDAILADESEVRNLGKRWWIVLIIFLPLIGSIAWLVAGRPHRRPPPAAPWPATRTAGFPEYERPPRPLPPDDDPEFQREMRRHESEREGLLRQWEDDLRRREQALREDDAGSEDDLPRQPQ